MSPRSLRYYETQGLLASSRTPSGQRHYDDRHAERAALIQAFLAAGISSRTIAGMVPCMATPSVGGAEQAVETLCRERVRLSNAIDSFAAARRALDNLIEANRRYLAASDDLRPAPRPEGPELFLTESHESRPGGSSTLRPA